MSWQQYKQFQKSLVENASGAKLVILAYQRCIQNLNMIEAKIKAFRFSEIEPLVEQTTKIIQRLYIDLDPTPYPALAEDFEKLYLWLIEELNNIRLKRESEHIPHMVQVLTNLMDGLKGGMENEKNEKL